MLIYHLYIFFDEMSVYVLYPLFNSISDFLIVEFLKILFILWIAVLYQICILQIFSLG